MLFSNYVEHTNVNGILGLTEKIIEFATGVGWVLEDYREGTRYVQDAVPYGFRDIGTPVPDAYYSLFHLSSTGWGGNQGLLFRFGTHNFLHTSYDSPRCGVSGHCTQDYAMTVAPCKSTTYVAEGNNRHPVCQNEETYNLSEGSYPEGLRVAHDTPIPRVTLIGDSTFIFGVLTHDNIFYQHFYFGSFQPLDATMPTNADCASCGTSCVPGTSYDNYAYPWEVYKTAPAPYNTKPYMNAFFNRQADTMRGCMSSLIRGGKRLDGSVNCFINYEGLQQSSQYCGVMYPYYDEMTCSRTVGGRYNMMKTVYGSLRAADGAIEPFAVTPLYCCNCQNEEPGTILTYGTDKFLIFPDGTLESDRWFAFRIQ